MAHSTSGVMMSDCRLSSFGPIFFLTSVFASVFDSFSAPFSRGCVLHDTIKLVIMANRNSLVFLIFLRFRNLGVKIGNNTVHAETNTKKTAFLSKFVELCCFCSINKDSVNPRELRDSVFTEEGEGGFFMPSNRLNTIDQVLGNLLVFNEHGHVNWQIDGFPFY